METSVNFTQEQRTAYREAKWQLWNGEEMSQIHQSNTVFEKFEYFDDEKDQELCVTLDLISPENLLLEEVTKMKNTDGLRNVEADNTKK